MFVILAGGGRAPLRSEASAATAARYHHPPRAAGVLGRDQRALEQAWVAFRTGFHPTDDANKIGDTLREQALK